MMKYDGKMDSRTPKHYHKDKVIDGYLFFTDNLLEASMFGFNTLLTDLRMDPKIFPNFIYNVKSKSKDSVTLAIRTSQIKEN